MDIACNVHELYEEKHIIKNNEKIMIPFSWTISQISLHSNDSIIKSLTINDVVIDTNVTAYEGLNYRYIIELWIYNEELSVFQFNWKDEGFLFLWNQIWFNVII